MSEEVKEPEKEKEELTFQEFGDIPKENLDEEISITIGEGEGENDQTGEPKAESVSLTTAKFWTINFYAPFFDADDSDFFKKIFFTIFPIRKSNFSFKPDLWGPFWIVTTFIVVLVISNNLAGAIYHKELIDSMYFNNLQKNTTNPFSPTSITEWANDFSVFSVGSIVIYSFAVIVPVLLWIFYRWKKIEVGVVNSISLYGYSFMVAIPFCAACIVNFEIMRWGMILVAFFFSSLVIILNSWRMWSGKINIFYKLGVCLFIFAVNFILALFVKFFFFMWNFWEKLLF